MTSRELAIQGLANWIEFLNKSRFINGEIRKGFLEQINEMLNGLENKVTVLISGEFNAGKSTFINALLGEEVLVSDVTPATAMITKLTYGKEKKLFLHFKNQTVEEYRFSSLKQVTAEGDKYGDKIRKKLAFIEIQLPFEMLKFYSLIDSPGLTSLFQKHSDVTDQFLEEADAAFWLFNSMNVGTASELTWLQKLHDKNIPIFGLVNGIDRLDEDEDLDAFYEYNVRRLSPLIAHLDGISSKDILTGKLRGDEQLKEWGNLNVVESLFTNFESEKLEPFYSNLNMSLHELYSFLSKEKESSVFLDNREVLLALFAKMETPTMNLLKELKEAYQKKENLIAEWNFFLQNNPLEPMNTEPFIARFKNPLKLRAEWESMVGPQLRNYIKWFEDIQLDRKVLNVKKLAAEEHFQQIDQVYFKFLQTYKYLKADREYRAQAEMLQKKLKLLNSDQKEVEISLEKFCAVVNHEIKKEFWPINERIKKLNMEWQNQLRPITQAIGVWRVEDLFKMEDYAEEIKRFQKQVLPHLHLALEKHSVETSNRPIQNIMGLLSILYREKDQSDILDRIAKVGSLKDPVEKFTVRTVNTNLQPSLQYRNFMPVPRALLPELFKLSPQLIKDPGVVATGVAILMSIF